MIKRFAKRILQGSKASSESYITHLRSLGMKIGEDVIIYAPTKTSIDETYPWMISIGNHVRITVGTTILAHDYSWSVLKQTTGGIFGASGKVEIGNNVFIGWGSTILRGVRIEDNVIIGAGSVVTKDCLANGVYAGNPARRVMDLDTYLVKRQAAQVKEATELAVVYYDRYGKRPPEEIFHEFFPLFLDKHAMLEREWCRKKLRLTENYEKSLMYMDGYERPFKNYQEFLDYAFNNREKAVE